MKISLNWIKEFVDLNGVDIKDLINRFTLSTAEIEEVVEMGKDIHNVVAGRIVSVEKHPSSDKLTIVRVDIGDGVVQSVCGAPNVKEGIVIPFAKVGGEIKNAKAAVAERNRNVEHRCESFICVEKTMVAGAESNGICCSESEIGFSEDHSGLMILDDGIKPGTDIKEILQLEDVIIEIDNKSLTHRPDLWGHYGIAREVAALVARPLKSVDMDMLEDSKVLPEVKVIVEDAEKCFRYSCLRIENIRRKVSPENIRLRLFYCGVRPISLIVDLTNYIMLELGQPMHSFDGKDVEEIIVRSTKEDSVFTTLDGVERRLSADTLMICNEAREVAIAGVMGGMFSEVSENTDSILLESASFEGTAIRRSALKVGIRTEASTRFEKVLDPELTVMSIRRYSKLLRNADSGARVSSALADVYPKKYDKVVINIEKSYIDKYMGKVISNDEIVKILQALEFKVEVSKVEISNEVFRVTVPSFRATKDVSIKADIVEEISRIYGYNNIEPKTCTAALELTYNNENRNIEHKVKEMLSENYEFSEVHSYLWYDNIKNLEMGIGKRSGLKIINSNSDTNEVIRDSMVPSMLYFADVNKKHADEFKIFEIGSVITEIGSDNVSNERKKLCILVASRKKSENEIFYYVKGLVNIIFETIKNVVPDCVNIGDSANLPWINPGKAANVIVDGVGNVGVISVLHPMIRQNLDKKLNIAFAEIDMFKLYEMKKVARKAADVSRFPEVALDLSILVNKEKQFDAVFTELKRFESQYLSEVRFIDIFEGKDLPEDKKSMTFNFRFGSMDKTLLGEEIDGIKAELIGFVNTLGYQLR